MINTILKKSLPHLLALVSLFLINAIFFAPQLLEDKKIEAGDAISSTAWSKQVQDHYEETGEIAYWNPSMFSGMPWGMLTYGVDDNVISFANKVLHLGFAYPVGLFFKISVVCYLSLILLGVNPIIGFLGAVALSLNINYVVLVGAGHQSKLDVISTFPLIVSAFILAFRKKWLTGAGVLAFALSIAIFRNHIQMVYYLMLCFVVFGGVYSYYLLKDKQGSLLLKSSLFLLVAALIGAASNFSQLYSSKRFSENTMRGKPILEQEDKSKQANSSSEVEGLEWNYAMQWSNNLSDVFSLIIPTFVGGSSAEEIPADTKTGNLLVSNGQRKDTNGDVDGAPMYWGALPFTSGPYYSGIILFMLFVLSLFYIDRKLAVSSVLAILLLILLSMGKHAAWLNKTLFDVLPLFNKFRAPNSIMNLVPVFMVIPAALGLQQFLKKPAYPSKPLLPLYTATALSAGLMLFFLVLGGSLLSFSSPQDSRYNQQIIDVFMDTRRELFNKDVLRLLLFSLIGAGGLWLYTRQKIKSTALLLLLSGITLIDLWMVDKRYLDEGNFVKQKDYESIFKPRPSDQMIFSAEPKGRGFYRVLDLSINTFNSASTSYHHNTIGGYHAAKLQRYQDLIDYHISNGNQRVLNMLNTRYVINQKGEVNFNKDAYGTAWFVRELKEVNSPLEEINALSSLDTRSQAVILGTEFAQQLPSLQPGNGEGNIELERYEVDELTYRSESPEAQLAVFSEVWYPFWEVYIDDKPAEMVRVNYILRALQVPAGEHTISFKFIPESKGKLLTIASSSLIGLFLLFLLWKGMEQMKKEGEPAIDVSEGRRIEERTNPTRKKRKK